jgi:hypothetical protein
MRAAAVVVEEIGAEVAVVVAIGVAARAAGAVVIGNA